MEFGDDYYKKDDYLYANGNRGLIKTMNGNEQSCKAECNKLDNCAGFNSKDGKCSFYNEEMYPNNKELDGPYPGAKMFMRERKVKNHPTCNTRVTPITSDEISIKISPLKKSIKKAKMSAQFCRPYRQSCRPRPQSCQSLCQ